MSKERYKALALLVTALSITGALALMSFAPPTRADTTSDATKTLTVSGSGIATGIPDTYAVTFSVVGVNNDPNGAMLRANDIYEALVSSLGQAGYNTSLLTLSSLSVYPEYYYPSNSPPVLQDYKVVYSLQYKEVVASSTPSTLGGRAAGVIVAAVKSGVKDISGVGFSLSDPSAASLKGLALALAASDAKSKAQILAVSLGVQVLGVQSVQATDTYSPPIFWNLNGAALDSSKTPQFNAGPATETAQVTVTFVIG